MSGLGSLGVKKTLFGGLNVQFGAGPGFQSSAAVLGTLQRTYDTAAKVTNVYGTKAYDALAALAPEIDDPVKLAVDFSASAADDATAAYLDKLVAEVKTAATPGDHTFVGQFLVGLKQFWEVDAATGGLVKKQAGGLAWVEAQIAKAERERKSFFTRAAQQAANALQITSAWDRLTKSQRVLLFAGALGAILATPQLRNKSIAELKVFLMNNPVLRKEDTSSGTTWSVNVPTQLANAVAKVVPVTPGASLVVDEAGLQKLKTSIQTVIGRNRGHGGLTTYVAAGHDRTSQQTSFDASVALPISDRFLVAPAVNWTRSGPGNTVMPGVKVVAPLGKHAVLDASASVPLAVARGRIEPAGPPDVMVKLTVGRYQSLRQSLGA